MTDLSPKFPLYFDNFGGYASNTTIIEVVKQNFKNLLLTSPGERIMIPDFGVGVRNYLFEQNSRAAVDSLYKETINQVEKYMPFIEIQEFNAEYEENQLIIGIKYFVIPISVSDILNLAVR